MRIQAYAHVVPALDRPATARPFVIEARPFVVLFRHFIEHARTDIAITVAPVPQQVDYSRQGKAGARALAALIEDVKVVGWIDFAFQLHKRGFVNPVAKIRCVSYRRQAILPKFVLCGIGHGDSSLTLVNYKFLDHIWCFTSQRTIRYGNQSRCHRRCERRSRRRRI